uniref:G-patch domain-containing protein n=5 Tax=Nymphaea colorata TaxID=210225 RepID=A0A5K1BFC8_9MAGN
MVETRSQAKQTPQNEASSSELRPETLGLPAIEPEAYYMFRLFMERFMKEQEEQKALMVTPETDNEKTAKQKRKKKNKSFVENQDEDHLSSDSTTSKEEKPELSSLKKKKTTKKNKKGKDVMIENSSPSPITTESSEEKHKRKRKPTKKVKKTKKYITSSSSDGESSEEKVKEIKGKKKKTRPELVESSDDESPTKRRFYEMEKRMNNLELRGKGKHSYSCEDYYLGIEGDEDVKGLPREFIRYDGTTCPHVHLSTFFNDCYKIRTNNRALFQYFPRSLEGIAAQWYKENINPIELKEFDKLINMFVERFEQNAPMAPTLSTICSLRQKQGEKAREFIQKWRMQCNKMKEPISETQALSLIRKNLAQPLKSLIRNAPIKTFAELIEQANSIEEGIEEGDFDGITAPKYKEDGKKGGRTQLPAQFIANAGIRKDHDNNYKHDKGVSFKKNTQFLKGDDERKNKHPGWSYDRKFTPLSQSREKILEYLLAKGTIVLPKVSEPPKMMGGNKEKLCKFHRTPGHDTEDCFVLKNIIQDFINKDLKICDDSTPEILRNPFPDHGKAVVAMITTVTPLSYHPQEHIRPYIGSSSHKIMVVNQGKEPLDFITMMKGRIESLPKKLPMIPKTFILQGDESSNDSSDEDPCYLDVLPLEERMDERDSIQASKNQSITFSEKDLSKWGYFHEDALYIVVQVNGMTVPHVLIDGGSGLNICPDLTAKTLGFRENEYRSDNTKIYGYDGRGMNSKGTLDMNVIIENTSHCIVFHVVDVPPSYNLLLGRPWIHQVRAIPSTLHQCLKWNFGPSVITVRAEDPVKRLMQPMLPRPIDPVDVPSIRTTKDRPLEEWMQNMEIEEPSGNAYAISSNRASYQEHLLYVHFMKNPKGFQLLLKGGYRPFTGLGKNEDGILQPISISFQMNMRGLGYHEGI